MSLNKVMLIGNVGKDPEIRYLENAPAAQGTTPKVATFPLATSERYRDRNGEVKENTEWHNIVVWRALADTVEKYVKKGTQLYVEGRLRTRSWTDQTGAKRYSTEINADSIQLLGRRADNPAAAQQQPGGYQAQGYQVPAGFQASAGYPAQTPAAPAGQYAPQQPASPNYQSGADPTDDLPF
jgi:single-strand DNA-binding protein